MRPPEIDVTFVLQTLHCSATEDTEEDEPYLWNLGFKVDADTLGPPPTGSLVPSLGVRVFPGMPFFAHVVGADGMEGGDTAAIAPQLGNRTFRLRPALLPLVGWFPGIAGLITLLWDEDGMSPATAEAGLAAFKAGLGPALTTQLDALMVGAFDAELAKDGNGHTLPNLPPASISWRLDRLANADGRRNAVKAIVKTVRDDLTKSIFKAVFDAASWDELIDRDDLLGAEAQVYLGNELRGSFQGFDMRFTDNDADYGIHGIAGSQSALRVVLDAAVIRADRTFDRDAGLWRRVCWGPETLYWAQAYLVATTTRFSLRPVLGQMPSAIRWFIDDRPVPAGASTFPVTFTAVRGQSDAHADVLAPFYPGGAGTLAVNATGSTLEVSHPGGFGVFSGQVRALYAYPGDPSLFPVPEPPVVELLGLGYDLMADLDVAGVDVVMDDRYREDIRHCLLTVREIDLKRIPIDWGRGPIGPGDPPNWRAAIEETRTLGQLVRSVPGLDAAVDRPEVHGAIGTVRRRLPTAS